MDDDVEDIFEGKRCCEGGKVKSVSLPAGALAVLAKDARQRMKKHDAYLWSVSTTSNPMYGAVKVTQKNGLCHLPQKGAVHSHIFILPFFWWVRWMIHFIQAK